MKRSISFNLFIRALTILSLCAGLIGSVGLAPRSARANVQPSCSTTPRFTNGTFITGGKTTEQEAPIPVHLRQVIKDLAFLLIQRGYKLLFPLAPPHALAWRTISP
jgi:hypothetical protein